MTSAGSSSTWSSGCCSFHVCSFQFGDVVKLVVDRVLTAEQLRESLDYDRATGVFRWKVRPSNRVRVGGIAGGVVANGYRGIRLSGQRYLAHQLAWLHVNGAWPTGEIDHWNEVKDDNRIVNLRDVTRTQNMQNISAPLRGNTSGFRGVSPTRSPSRWKAQIKIDGKAVYLGTFDSPKEASAAYWTAKRRFHLNSING